MGSMTMKTKLATAFGVLLFFIVGIGVYSYYATSTIQSKSEEVGAGWMSGTERLNAILDEMNLLRRRNILRMTPADAAAKAKKDSEIKNAVDNVNRMLDEYRGIVDNYKYYKTDADKAAKQKLVADVQKAFKDYCVTTEKMVKLNNEGKEAESVAMISGESKADFDKIVEMLNGAIEKNKTGAHDAVEDGAVVYKTTAYTMIIVVLLAIIIGFGVAVWLIRDMNKSLAELSRVSETVSKGNLTVRAVAVNDDEFGQLAKEYNMMIENVRNLIAQIHSSAQQVAAASEELTASSDESAKVTMQIATSITEVAASADRQVKAVDKTTELIVHISAGVEETSATASESAGKTAEAVEQAKSGGETIAQSVKQMESIAVTVNDTASVVTKLGERSKEIGNIVDTISGIAGQTNLLALNAAIEAARAGEHGKGFAVVAEEVRKLAEQSGEAAKRIEELINAIQVETDAAVTAMNNGTLEVKKGTEITHQAGLAFRDIMTTVEAVNHQSKEIATTMEELAKRTEQVSEAGQQIDAATQAVSSETQSVSAATQEQSAAMEEIASGSRSLADLAQELQMASEKFKI